LADNYSVDQAVKWIDAVELQLHQSITETEHFAVDFENRYFGGNESNARRRSANRLACTAKSMNLAAFAG